MSLSSLPHSLRAWISAARPKTLVAAAVPIAVGSAVAERTGGFRSDVAAAAFLAATLIQIGTNLANDVYDFEQGADTAERLGPPRAVASGMLTKDAVKRAMVLVFLSAILTGTYLVFSSGFWVIPLGLASVAAGILYTRGKRSLAYLGLGDVFVLVFFGFVAVAGTAYAESGVLDLVGLLAGAPVGALATVLLVVNNTRDRAGDAAAGKRTLVVRFGVGFARFELACLLALAYLVPAALAAFGFTEPRVMITLCTVPLAASILLDLFRRDGRALNQTLGRAALLLVSFGALFALTLA